MVSTEFDWENGEDAFPGENVPLTGDDRTEARICAVQALYQALVMKRHVDDVAKEFELARLGKRKADKKLFRLVCAEAAAGDERYKEMISANLTEGWEWARMDAVLRAVLWAGCAELTANDKASPAVVLNEYVNISKGFLEADQVAFVNKTLDGLAKKIRG